MAKKRFKGVSDGNLQGLWRKAVRKRYNYRCAFCNASMEVAPMECHHIVKRRHAIYKNDYRNGILLCKKDCHESAHTLKGHERVKGIIGEDYDYLIEHSDKTIKDYLSMTGMTRNEFLLMRKNELNHIIKEG